MVVSGMLPLTENQKSNYMKTNRIFLGLASLLIAFVFVFTACTKSGVNGGEGLQVYLTDGPTDLKAVSLDIVKVEAKVDNDEKHRDNDRHGDNDDDKDDDKQRKDDFGEWIDLQVTPGVINVLELRNGVEKMIASASNVKGRVRKIRVTLGTNNSVTLENGENISLTLLNETKNMIYIKLYDEHRGRGSDNRSVAVRIDFDLGSSIVLINGKFYLKPVVRPFCNENFGEVEGKVLPLDAKAVVRITDGASFNAVALPFKDGEFKLRGIKPGTYTVTIEPIAPYLKETISNVVVTKGKDTELGTITLKK
jgi:hypothetical protein